MNTVRTLTLYFIEIRPQVLLNEDNNFSLLSDILLGNKNNVNIFEPEDKSKGADSESNYFFYWHERLSTSQLSTSSLFGFKQANPATVPTSWVERWQGGGVRG